MKKKSPMNLLRPLLKQPFFNLEDAENKGVSRHAVAYLAKKGLLERLSKGVYRASDYEPNVALEWENLALAAASIPKGVICLISALCYYDLTDQIMRESWIAIPHRLRAPKRSNVRIVRMRNTDLGKRVIKLGEYTVSIFDRERTIIDAFRYLSKEIAIKAVQKYFHRTDYRPQPQKLAEYAKLLRVDIMPYILSYTT